MPHTTYSGRILSALALTVTPDRPASWCQWLSSLAAPNSKRLWERVADIAGVELSHSVKVTVLAQLERSAQAELDHAISAAKAARARLVAEIGR